MLYYYQRYAMIELQANNTPGLGIRNGDYRASMTRPHPHLHDSGFHASGRDQSYRSAVHA